MCKVIATDLDGTLFYPKDKKRMIVNQNLFFLQSFVDKGGKLILVTGRSQDYGYKVIEKIGRECALISYNGAALYDGKKCVFKKNIENNIAIDLFEKFTKEYKIPGVFMMSDRGLTIWLKYKSKLIRWFYIQYYKTLKIYAENIHYEKEAFYDALKNDNIYKMMLYFGLGKVKRNRASNATSKIRKSNTDIEANWSKNVVEITASGCYKANVLKKYCEENGYDFKDVFVVGDSGNDISMFKEFYDNSFCMNHGPKNVKKHAKYVIKKFEDLSRYIYKK